MARTRTRKVHGDEDLWHLSIEDLLSTPRESARLAKCPAEEDDRNTVAERTCAAATPVPAKPVALVASDPDADAITQAVESPMFEFDADEIAPTARAPLKG